jgi:hypothetical protein
MLSLAAYCMVAVLPLVARGVEESRDVQREVHPRSQSVQSVQRQQQNYHKQNYNQAYHPYAAPYMHPNYNNGNYGSAGGYSSGAYPYPYPNAPSQPGMSDDSNALYQSQLRSNGAGY